MNLLGAANPLSMTNTLIALGLALVLGVGIPLMWLASGVLVWGLLGLPFWVAMLVGATIIVTGRVAERSVPARLRHLISAESGANDGMMYPLVLLPILILTRPTGESR